MCQCHATLSRMLGHVICSLNLIMSKTEQTTLQDGDDGGSDPIIPGDLEAAQVEIPGVQNINIEEWTSLKLTYTGKEFSLSVEKSDRLVPLSVSPA